MTELNGFNFRVVRPCADCPFRRDVPPFLHGRRARSIAEDLERKSFACHETTYREQPRGPDGKFRPALPKSHCAGVLIIMAREGRWGDMQQLALRLGLFDPDKLAMDAPTYDTLEAFVAANGGGELRWVGGRGDEYERRRKPRKRKATNTRA